MKPFRKYSPIQIRWAEPLGKPECPYAYRWVLNLWFFSIRLHHFMRSDDKRYMHDHPFNFWTWCIKGEYTDVSMDDDGNIVRDHFPRWSLRHRPAEHKHYVDVPVCGSWTILLCGRKCRNWGFWIGEHREKFKRPLKYFHKYGHPACDDQ
jgi:hypothetical protein